MRYFIVLFLVFVSCAAYATVETRATGQAGVASNLPDNTNGQITPAKMRTELNDLWDSSVLQGELETLVDPIIDAAMAGGGAGTANEYLYTPTDGTCTTDMSTEFEAFLTAHDGIVIQKAGTCIRLDDGGKSTSYVFEGGTDIIWRCETPGECQAGNTNSNNTIQYYVPDGIALDSKTLVSAVQNDPTTAINKDDVLPYVTVASTTGYNVGDIAKIVDSVPLPNRLGSTKTITNVAWNGSACVVTTSSSHGYSDTRFVLIKGVTGTGSIDTIDGVDGYGRTYNITSLSSTTFSLQTLSNSDGSSAGSTVDCSTGAYSSGGVSAVTATWAGEDVKIAGVDTIQNRIYFTHKLGFGPLYVQSPVLYRYTEARKVDIRGIKFVSIGDTSDLSIGVSDAAIDILGVPRAVFEDIDCEDNWDACIVARSTPFSKIQNIKGNLLKNRGTDDPSGTPKTITSATVASQAVFTSASHGFSSNAIVILNNMPTGWEAFEDKGCKVSDVATNTFKCKDTYDNYFNSSSFAAFSGSSSAGEAADVTGLGYLVSVNSGQLGTVVNGVWPEEGRHGVTTDGSALSWKATLSATDSQVARFGVPTYFLITNGKCTGGNGVCWDEHEESYRSMWSNLWCDYSERGPDFGSYKGQCFQGRGDGTIIKDMTCIGGQSCLRFPPSDWFRDRQFSLDNIMCRDQVTLQDTVKNADKCIQFGNSESGSYSSYTNSAKFDVGRVTTISTSLPLWIDKRVTVNIDSLNAQDYDDIADCGAGANLTINSVISSHADPKSSTGPWTHKIDIDSNGFNIVNARSDGTYGGCDTTLGDVVNTQGTGSNYLQDVLEQVDTTAVKKYTIGSYTEHNPNGTTAGRLVESGATTFSKKLTSTYTRITDTEAAVGYRNIKDYGAFCDGSAHPLSAEYASLGAAQADFPLATALTQEKDQIVIEREMANNRYFYIPEGSTCLANFESSLSSKTFNIKMHENATIKGSGSSELEEMFSCSGCTITAYNLKIDAENKFSVPLYLNNPGKLYFYNTDIRDFGWPVTQATNMVAPIWLNGTMTSPIVFDKMYVADVHAVGNGTYGDNIGGARMSPWIVASASQKPNILIKDWTADAVGSDAEELDMFNQNVNVIYGSWLTLENPTGYYNGKVRRWIKVHSGDAIIKNPQLFKASDFVTAPTAAGSTSVGEKNLTAIDNAGSGQGSITMYGGSVDVSGFPTGFAGTSSCTDCYIKAIGTEFVGALYNYDRYNPELTITGTAQAGGASTITLAAATSSTANNFYNGATITITAGTASGQTGTVSSYVGATHVATMTAPWGVQPDATSVYSVFKAELGSAIAFATGSSDRGSGCDTCYFKDGYVGFQARGYQSFLRNSFFDDPVSYPFWVNPASSARTGITIENNTVVTKTTSRLKNDTGGTSLFRIAPVQVATDYKIVGNKLIQDGNTDHQGVFIDELTAAVGGVVAFNACPATYTSGAFTCTRKNAAATSKVVGTNYALESVLDANTTAVGNVGAGTDTLQTYSIASNNLSAAGQGTVMQFSATYANNANAKTFHYDIGGTDVVDLTLTTGQAGVIEGSCSLWRTGASTQLYQCSGSYTGAAAAITPFATNGTLTLTDTSAIAVRGEGIGVSDNDISMKFHYIKKAN